MGGPYSLDGVCLTEGILHMLRDAEGGPICEKGLICRGAGSAGLTLAKLVEFDACIPPLSVCFGEIVDPFRRILFSRNRCASRYSTH